MSDVIAKEKGYGSRRTWISASKDALQYLVKDLLSIEGILVLYMWAGVFKAMLPANVIMLDSTVVLGTMLIGRLCLSVLAGDGRRIPFSILTVYGTYVMVLLLSTVYSDAPQSVVIEKVFRLVFVDGLSVVATMFLITNLGKVRRFMRLHVLLAMVVVILALVDATPGLWASALTVHGASSISCGRLVGVALCMVVGWLGLSRPVGWATAAVLLGGLLVISARGPIIAALLACVICTACRIRLKMLRFRLIVRSVVGLSTIVALVFVLNSWGYLDTLRLRMHRIGFDDASIVTRLNYASLAWNMFLERPVLGWGLGGFELRLGVAGSGETPHNLVLELLSETGLLGFVPFASLVLLAVYVSVAGKNGLPKDLATGLVCALAFWIATVPALAVGSARPFLSMVVLMGRPYADRRTNMRARS